MITKSLAQKQKEKESYNQLAANWWAEEIQGNKKDPVKGLENFRSELSLMIKMITSLRGSMVISTFQSPSKLLNEVALNSKLDTSCIPSGYEMKIIFNNVEIFDSCGILVESF